MSAVRWKLLSASCFLPIPYVLKALHHHFTMTDNIRMKFTYYIHVHNVSSHNSAHWGLCRVCMNQ